MNDQTQDKWLLLRNAPQDTDDPYIIAARRRRQRSNDLSPLVGTLGERPWFIDTEKAPRILDEFRAQGCEIKELDVRDMDEEALLARLGALYDFPDYYGVNWDAYSDCYLQFVEAGEAPVVLAASGFDTWKESDFRLFFRTVYELESVTRLYGNAHRVIARRVLNLYIGDWD